MSCIVYQPIGNRGESYHRQIYRLRVHTPTLLRTVRGNRAKAPIARTGVSIYRIQERSCERQRNRLQEKKFREPAPILRLRRRRELRLGCPNLLYHTMSMGWPVVGGATPLISRLVQQTTGEQGRKGAKTIWLHSWPK